MKKDINIFLLFLVSLLIFSCNSLDLNPLSQASSENWYNDETEINMSVNDLYKAAFWDNDDYAWSDDWTYRETLTPITSGTINGEWSTVGTFWANSYKAITRANILIENLESDEVTISEELIQKFIAEARFTRAYQYSKLISHFGDVVYFTGTLDLEDAYQMERTDKNVILNAIYEDFDFASQNLPESYSSSEIRRATKGAALGFKARIALYNQDWETAKEASKKCMELGVYSLHSDYGDLFLPNSGNSDEIIFAVPRSTALKSDVGVQDYIPRNQGGWAAFNPSWDLFSAYLCTDGFPIDRSPLYNPQTPFKNRDPRLSYTIVPFQTPHLGIMYQPHPDSTEVLNVSTGRYQVNNDTKSTQQFSSFNGLIWKKGVDESWLSPFRAENPNILLRFADVLLMYAEAKVELDELDESVFSAINQVRARAYKVEESDFDLYPAITVNDQTELRRVIRLERRIELTREGLRYMDLIRWRLAEKALNRPNYGLLDAEELKEKLVNKNLWFFPSTPDIDEDGLADFSDMATAGQIKIITNRKFDASRQYLWPIPTKEILINKNMKQNPGY